MYCSNCYTPAAKGSICQNSFTQRQTRGPISWVRSQHRCNCFEVDSVFRGRLRVCESHAFSHQPEGMYRWKLTTRTENIPPKIYTYTTLVFPSLPTLWDHCLQRLEAYFREAPIRNSLLTGIATSESYRLGFGRSRSRFIT